jgi:intracellular multiplication protein IcmV
MKKKKSGSRIGSLLSGIFRIRAWADWDRVKEYSLYLGNGIKDFVVPNHKASEESFEDALARLEIGEQELLIKQKALYRLSLVMVGAAVFILFYTGYLLFYGTWRAVMVSSMVMVIALILAFRYHFWYFQMKSRKLGCTFQEWYRVGLLGEKK